MTETLLVVDEALALARRGFAVFPCNADKTPRTPSGFKDASSDSATVARGPWEGALIGMAIPEGVVVIDIDPRNGGDKTLAEFPALPATYEVSTASGGRHLYYAVDPEVELCSTFGAGVDIKRHGRGYVIVPPSRGYAVADAAAQVPLPEWLLEALLVPERDERIDEAHSPKFFDWKNGTAYGLRALDLELEDLRQAGLGGRNDQLNRAAFALAQLHAGGELDGEKARNRLQALADEIGLEPLEIEKTIASAWRAGLEKPRQAPETNPFAGLDKPREDDSMWLRWDGDAEPIVFLLYPIIPEKAYVWVYGPAAASKSMVFTGLAAQASHEGIRSTIYSLENPRSIDHDRVKRFNPDPANFRLTNTPIDFNDRTQVDELIEREQAWETRLLVIDTYAHATGDRSDDGNARAIQFARAVRRVMQEVGCAVVVLDHTGYAHDEPRDASAKRQQVDVCVLMAQADERWEPGRDAQFRMENRKAARFGNPFELAGEIKGRRHEPLSLAWHGEAPAWQVTL